MTKQNASRKFFQAPVFPGDENKTRQASYLSKIVPSSIAAMIVLMLLRIGQGVDLLDLSNIVLAALCAVLLFVWGITKSGAVAPAGYMTVGVVWVASTVLAMSGSGIRGVGYASYFVVMLLAGLLLGARAAAWIALLSILSGFGLAYAESTGIIPLSLDPPFVVAVEYAFLFVISTMILRLAINGLQNALTASSENARKLEVSNQELTGLRDELELRIGERTASLEKRAAQLEAVSRLARSIASIKDLDSLLSNTTTLVSEQFGFYHAGIFLLDESNEFAVLKAANSEGGMRMLARGHQLAMDTNSIVGYVASLGVPRIALDVGADSVYFNNPDLPDTRSEMALPLRASDRVIGILDVQSKETNAFVQEDMLVLSTLADQIAVAIENARLYDENQKALAESRSTFEKYIKHEWSSFAQEVKQTGFKYDGKHMLPIDGKPKMDSIPSAEQAVESSQEKSSKMTLPIKVRGQVIGSLDVRSKSGNREWTGNEINLLEAAAERAGLALENARLVESAQRRAARERSIGEISAKIGAVSDIDSILQTTVEELGRKLSGVTEVMLELDPEQI